MTTGHYDCWGVPVWWYTARRHHGSGMSIRQIASLMSYNRSSVEAAVSQHARERRNASSRKKWAKHGHKYNAKRREDNHA